MTICRRTRLKYREDGFTILKKKKNSHRSAARRRLGLGFYDFRQISQWFGCGDLSLKVSRQRPLSNFRPHSATDVTFFWSFQRRNCVEESLKKYLNLALNFKFKLFSHRRLYYSKLRKKLSSFLFAFDLHKIGRFLSPFLRSSGSFFECTLISLRVEYKMLMSLTKFISQLIKFRR